MPFKQPLDRWVGVALLCAVAVPFLPASWPAASLIQSVPTLPFLAAICLMLAFLGRRLLSKRYVLAGLCVAGSAPFIEAPGDPSQPRAQELRVVSWNTEYWDQNEGTAALASALRALDADVLMLQEHLYWDAASETTQDIDKYDILRTCCGFSHVWRQGELVTASRLPGSQNVDVSDEFVLLVSIGGTTFANVHVPVHITQLYALTDQRFWDFLSAASVKRSMTFSALETVLDGTEPVVVGGDFNATLLMPQMRKVARRANLSALPLTFPNTGLPLWKLDQLGDSADRVSDCHTVSISEDLSDHLPLACTLKLSTES